MDFDPQSNLKEIANTCYSLLSEGIKIPILECDASDENLNVAKHFSFAINDESISKDMAALKEKIMEVVDLINSNKEVMFFKQYEVSPYKFIIINDNNIHAAVLWAMQFRLPSSYVEDGKLVIVYPPGPNPSGYQFYFSYRVFN